MAGGSGTPAAPSKHLACVRVGAGRAARLPAASGEQCLADRRSGAGAGRAASLRLKRGSSSMALRALGRRGGGR